jgi:hypothetical protein
MNIPTRVRTLVMVSLLAMTALTSPATQAHAKPKHPVDDGVRCAIQTGPGQYDFYLPGEQIVYRDGAGNVHVMQCNEEGDWVELDRTITPPSGPRVPRPAAIGS